MKKTVAHFCASMILLALLSGCAGLKPRPEEWTSLEKAAFAYSTGGHVVDAASSIKSDERCVEQNLILGDSPSTAALIALKAFMMGVEAAIYNSPNIDSKHTHWFGFVAGTIHFSAGISNFQNDCY